MAEQSAFDDLESAGYMMIYFLHGGLPWQGLSVQTDGERDCQILHMKQAISPAELCHDLPDEFMAFMGYIRDRDEQTPNYARLRRAFSRLFRQRGFSYDHGFDWTIRKYQEMSSD